MTNMAHKDIRQVLSLLREDYSKFVESYRDDLVRLRKAVARDGDGGDGGDGGDNSASTDSSANTELIATIDLLLEENPKSQHQFQSFRHNTNRLAELLNQAWLHNLGHTPTPNVAHTDTTTTADIDIMNVPIPKTPGAGAKTMELLAEIGVKTVGDVLHALPTDYEIYELSTTPLNEIAHTMDTNQHVFRVQYSSGQNIRTRNGRDMFIATFQRVAVDTGTNTNHHNTPNNTPNNTAHKFAEGGVTLAVGTKTTDNSHSHNYTGETITGLWFGSVGYLRTMLRPGRIYNLYGTLKEYSRRHAIFYPRIIKDDEMNIIKAKYAIPKSVKQATYARIVNTALDNYLGTVGETLPKHIRNKHHFPKLDDALKTLHQPLTTANCRTILNREHVAYKRFIYEELFYHQLMMLMRRVGYSSSCGEVMTMSSHGEKQIKKLLGFTLTDAQRRVLANIIKDISSKHQMNRLLEGDVGSGKTIVAFITCMIAAQNGYQSVIIAPTEVLADQHFKNLTKFLGGTNEECVLLTGSMGAKEKQNVKTLIASGAINFVIATHAVLEENVSFANLGMIIVDEQQRFGVLQRKNLMEKGFNPHVLLMTATPIPRTLALAMYGDLDLSVIDEMPPGRIHIETKVFNSQFTHGAHGILKNELEKGHKAYCVYPLISESENLPLVSAEQGFEEMTQVFGKYGVGLMHGRLKASEKRQLIDNFTSGAIQILVSTTVVEVGVDVKDATVMMINHAERFGLSQLHQLRGRVGRSNLPSHCLLLHDDNIGEISRRRLDAMVDHNDGFKLAAIDLELRGAGDFFGINQSGLPNFKYADILADALILEHAREDAEMLLKDDEFLDKISSRAVALSLKTKWKHLLEFSFVG